MIDVTPKTFSLYKHAEDHLIDASTLFTFNSKFWIYVNKLNFLRSVQVQTCGSTYSGGYLHYTWVISYLLLFNNMSLFSYLPSFRSYLNLETQNAKTYEIQQKQS